MTATTEIAQRTPTQELNAQIRHPQFKEQIQLALPARVSADRFIRATLTAVMQNPGVVAAERNSLLQSVIRCAQDGLMPDGREAALVVFGGKAQYMPMIGGYRKIAAKHGITLVADVVRQRDEFDWSKMPPRIEHKPALGDRGEIVCAYAAAFDRDWRFVAAPVVMDVAEIEKVRAVSRARDNGPWKDWWDRMACKTVARRLFNELPLGDLDDSDDRIVRQADVDVELPALDDTLTVEEADAVASVGQVTAPPDDAHPGSDPAATTDQHGRLLELVVQLSDAKPDTDWQADAGDYAQTNFGRTVVELTGGEMDELLAYMEAQLPPKRGRRSS